MHKKKLVVLTGAGISAESGIPTFRGSGGLWEGKNVQEVASPLGWQQDQAMVLDFYNQRRRQMVKCAPNAGHLALVELEKHFDLQIITQNIDNLHERAGSSNVLHLHGEILLARSTADPSLIYPLEGGKDILQGDLCEKGSQLRPHIVWFGEDVPEFENAVRISHQADLYMVVGTSLAVYPANTLINYTKDATPIYIVDPGKPDFIPHARIHLVQAPATTGIPSIMDELVKFAES